MAFLRFPDNFLFGSSSSAHQVEGNNVHNQWWHFEQTHGKIKGGNISGIAADHYNRFSEDFDDLQALRHEAHRISLEWSRFFPNSSDELNAEAVQHYHRVLDALVERGIEPFVTTFHFTIPEWFANMGGFEKEQNLRHYEAFVQFLVKEYGSKVRYWCTINEPNIYASFSYIIGEYPPAKKNIGLALRVLNHLIKAHAKAYRIIKAAQPNAQVGIVVHLPVFAPLRKGKWVDTVAAQFADWMFSGILLEALKTGKIHAPVGLWEQHDYIKDSNDFIGLNYYVRMFASPRHALATVLNTLDESQGVFRRTEAERLTQSGWAVYAKGLYKCLKRLHKKFDLPMYITENGIATEDDQWRKEFIRKHLKQVHKGIQKGFDVRGYFYWSNLDNFEWTYGFAPRFGLIHVDYENDCKRTVRGSAWMYAKIIEERGFEVEEKVQASVVEDAV